MRLLFQVYNNLNTLEILLITIESQNPTAAAYIFSAIDTKIQQIEQNQIKTWTDFELETFKIKITKYVTLHTGWGPCADFQLGLLISVNSVEKSLKKSRKQASSNCTLQNG